MRGEKLLFYAAVGKSGNICSNAILKYWFLTTGYLLLFAGFYWLWLINMFGLLLAVSISTTLLRIY